MSTVTTTKRINLAQLAFELGGKPLSLDDDGTTRSVTCHDQTTQAVLQAAVDAHLAIDEQGNRATLEQQATAALAANKDFIATNAAFASIANPTTAQLSAHVKELNRQATSGHRQSSGLIRLLLNRLDGTD